ncbi:Uncharacterised protein [Bordetella pertussis]|nr:Uncharacterised protein [Bordetella pertussis]
MPPACSPASAVDCSHCSDTGSSSHPVAWQNHETAAP